MFRKLFLITTILAGIFTFQAKADMTINTLFPANNATEVCYDTKLFITFATAPIVGTSGNLKICKVSDDSIVYQLNLQTLPGDTYGPLASGWPYQITLNGKTLNYQPFFVSGNVLEIYPSVRLEYNTAYYVTMTAGFCHDTALNNSPEIADNATWRFTIKSTAPILDHDYTVALDNSGDFCTMQGALDAVANSDTTRTIIRVKQGNYRGVMYIASNKINITLLGENRETTILSGYNREAFNSGSDSRMLLRSYGNNLRMYNLTLHNTAPDNSGQAETIKHSGNQFIIENCKFKSYQDTLCLNGQTYVKNSYIEGDTDYIWGTGTIYFDKCDMKCLSTQSYITQPRCAQNANGIFLVDCNIISPAGLTGCYLGRTTNDSYPYCQSVFINCTMPTSLILPIGWKNDYTATNLRWWEYKSKDPAGNLINVASRLNPGSRQLNDAEAVTWRDVTNVFQYSPWNPKVPADAPSAAWLPQPQSGATGVTSAFLTWSPGGGVQSHMVYFGSVNPPPFAMEVTTNSYMIDQPVTAGGTYYWRVDEKNSAGTTTGTVWSFALSETLDSTPPSPNPMVWAHEPNALNISTITMSVAAASDESGVEYFFTNVTDANHNSGWQDSNSYTDTGLVNNMTYTYKVKARDKSINHNQTDYSSQSSATTKRFECTAMIFDLSGDCQVNLYDYVIFADAWLLPRINTQKIINGTFDSELSPWAVADAVGAIGVMNVAFDSVNGLPAGSALLSANTTGLAVNNHRFYQVFPVTIGNKYRFSGKWKGSLYDPNAGTRRNWSEVFVGFSPDAVPSTFGNNTYKKRFVATGNSGNMNFSSTSDGRFDWEDISASPNNAPAPPTNDIYTADQPYMVVAFNIGGNSEGGSIWMDIDNISVVECLSSAGDINGDCELNMKDLAQIADNWLICTRNPSSECWQ